MTSREYLHSHATTGWVRITEIIPAAIPILRVEATCFYPQGGGQRADQGLIGPSRVLDVREHAGEVDHLVASIDGIDVGVEYPFRIDPAVRNLNAAYHTAGHLLMNVLEGEHPGLRGIKGHHWPGEARVVFEGQPAHPVDLESLNATLALLLAKALPVAIAEDCARDRTIRIGNFQPVPCGGVHVQSLAEIQSITVTRLKVKQDSSSVHYEVVARP